MAYYQIAYTFDVERFHADLESKVVKDGVFDYSELQRLAQAIMANPSDVVRDVAHFECYSEKWLQDETEHSTHRDSWYVINLWDALKPCPSLSNNRFYESHFILEDILPLVGWQEDDICALILGQWHEKLFNPHDKGVFAQNLRHYWPRCGALKVSECQRLLRQLKESHSLFLFPSASTIAHCHNYRLDNGETIRELLILAYWDARDMLETAIARKQALYISRG